MFVVFGSVCQRSIFTSQFQTFADLTWRQRASYFWFWYLCEAQVDEWKLVGTASSHHVFLTAGPPRSRLVQQTGNIGEEAQQLRQDEAGLSSSCALSVNERFKTTRRSHPLIAREAKRGAWRSSRPSGGAALARLPPRRNAGAAGSCSQQKMLLISAGCDFSFICGLFDTTAAGVCAYTQEVTERR